VASGETTRAGNAMKRIGTSIGLSLLLLAGGLLIGWFVPNPWNQSVGAKPQPNAAEQPPALAKVVAQGRIQPLGGFQNIFGPPGSRVSQLMVAEGARVEAGSELVRYTGQRSLEKQLELATSRTADLQRELQQKQMLAETNLQAAELALKNAKLNLSQAEAEQDLTPERERLALAQTKLAGLKRLAEDDDTAKLVSPWAVAEKEVDIRVAESELARAGRKLNSARESISLAVETAEQNRIAAERTLELARSAVESNLSARLGEEIAKLQVEESRLVAPVAGTVYRLTVRQGDSIGTTPLLQLGDSERLECVAEVNDTLAGKVKLGQRARLKSEALSRELSGKVVSIGRFVGLPTLRSPDPLSLVDRRAVEIQIELEPEDAKLAQAWLNLQVTVEIELESK
jgi:HlyD family secretion protein